MIRSTRTAIALIVVAQGLVGCDGANPRSPVAPSTVPIIQQPPSSRGIYTLTSSASTVIPGGVLGVSWTASAAAARDWIGLFKVGAAACDHGWSEYTNGATSGTRTLTAPTQSGQYEFRYHLNNSCDETARSSPVTVSQGS
jgi:hypothetical protein